MGGKWSPAAQNRTAEQCGDSEFGPSRPSKVYIFQLGGIAQWLSIYFVLKSGVRFPRLVRTPDPAERLVAKR